MTAPPPTAIPAATLVILREGTGGAPEILMVERATAMVFASGAAVFPGGRIDAADLILANDDEEGAARVAAIRETIEEVGLAIGVSPLPDDDTLARLRASLHAGTGFEEAIAAAGVTLDLAALTPFARWRPAHRERRVYDTRFYLARLPAGAPAASVDATENTRLFWARARETLAMADAGDIGVIFPTRRNLERLAQFATIEEIFADAGAYPVDIVTPWTEQRDGADHLCIPEGIGYPVTAERLDTARRG